MKAYSVDLRQKIIDVYTEGNLSQRQLAQQLSLTRLKTVGQKLKVFYVKSVPEIILMRVEALEFALAKVSKNEIRNWFTHCCYCTSLD